MAVGKQQVISAIEGLAPRAWAEEWDNSGLQVGDPSGRVDIIGVALTPDEATVFEAIRSGVGLLVTHHPLIFKGLKSVPTGNGGGLAPTGRIIKACLDAGMTVYSAHTNLDTAIGGINDGLMEALGILPSGGFDAPLPLKEHHREALFKLVAYIPVGDLALVREALWRAGAGGFDKYRDCAFHSVGQGTFTPMEGANPSIGGVGKPERVEEGRLEVLVPENRVKGVVKALLNAHPYEEPAYDLIRLENGGRTLGLGRYGILESSCTLGGLAQRVKQRLGCSSVRVIGDNDRMVGKVGVCGGSGAELLSRAGFMVDVLVTGDIKYHDALMALEGGLAVIDAGHYHTEMPGMRKLARMLPDLLGPKSAEVKVIEAGGDPFQSL